MSAKMKVLSRLFAGVAMIGLLAGCDDDSKKERAVKTYESVEKCRADIASDATEEERVKVSQDCQTALDKTTIEHERTVTRYATADQCNNMYSNCRPASDGNGFVPPMMGFMLGYMMAGGMQQPVYHPYYRDRWDNAYVGGSPAGYYRGGHVVAPPGSTWTRSYASTPIAKGSPPPAITSSRGGFGGSAAAAAGRSPIVSNASPSGRGGTSAVTPSSSSARGGFGGSAATASSSSSG